MGKRLRIVGWQVQPQLMVDDGENLQPLNTQPITIPHSEWDEFVDGGWEEAIGRVREQVEADEDE